jgi:uncharacterized protein YgiM (DUF1202 family)
MIRNFFFFLLLVGFVSASTPSWLSNWKTFSPKKIVKTVAQKINSKKKGGVYISSKLVKVKGQSIEVANCYHANLRSGPGVKFSVVKVVSRGDVFPLVGQAKGWSQIKTQTASPQTQPEPKKKFGWVKVQSSLNFRAEPWGRVIGTLYNGNRVEILGQEGKWFNVSYGGKSGFAHSNYIVFEKIEQSKPTQKSEPVGEKYVVTASSKLYVRDAPMGNVLGTLNSGAGIEVLKKSGNWCQIKYQGRLGWVHGDYVAPKTSTPAPTNSSVKPGESQSKEIYDTTLAMNGTSSKSGPGGGNVACAWMVNKVLKQAIGRTVNGDATASMYDVFETELILAGKAQRVSLDEAIPGDIVLSPTQYTSSGRNTGHVGVIGEGDKIYSNSSSKAKLCQNFTRQSWINYYQTKKGLPVYIYRILK